MMVPPEEVLAGLESIAAMSGLAGVPGVSDLLPVLANTILVMQDIQMGDCHCAGCDQLRAMSGQTETIFNRLTGDG